MAKISSTLLIPFLIGGEEVEITPAEGKIMSEELFGRVVTTIDVEEAFLTTLSTWMPEWLYQVELQKELPRGTLTRPPAPESYHGGDDFESWKADLLPEVIVDVKPSSLERSASAAYTTAYDVQVATILERQDEEEARFHASLHGAATMFLVQQPSLGGLAERLVMITAPTPEFLATDERRLARTIATFTVWVTQVVNESSGPFQSLPSESPYYQGEPEHIWKTPPEVTSVEEKIYGAAPWSEGRAYGLGIHVWESGVFYEAVKAQTAAEVHRPSEDSEHTYWKVV